MPLTEHSGYGFHRGAKVKVVKPRFITNKIGDEAKITGFTPRYVIGLTDEGLELYFVPEEIEVVNNDGIG